MLNQDGFILLTRTQPIRYAAERTERNGTTLGEEYFSRADYSYRTGWNEHIGLTKRPFHHVRPAQHVQCGRAADRDHHRASAHRGG